MTGKAEVHFNQRTSANLHFTEGKSQLRLPMVVLERHSFRKAKPLGFPQHRLRFGVADILAEVQVVN